MRLTIPNQLTILRILLTPVFVLLFLKETTQGQFIASIVSRDVIVTLVRIYAIQKGTPIMTSAIAKWKTFAQMAIILMILIFINWLNFYGPGSFTYKAQYFDFVGISTLVVTLLTLISAIFYFYENGQLIWQMMKRIFIFASK